VAGGRHGAGQHHHPFSAFCFSPPSPLPLRRLWQAGYPVCVCVYVCVCVCVPFSVQARASFSIDRMCFLYIECVPYS
jgi:hypothetical protein